MDDSDISRSFPLHSKLYLTLACLGIDWVIKHVNAKTLLFRTEPGNFPGKLRHAIPITSLR